jgi:signal transduction histidine kinase
MLGFLRREWYRFRGSYSVQDVGSVGYLAVLMPVAAMLAGLGGPAYLEMLAPKTQFQVPWLPVLLVALGLPASLMCRRVRAAGNLGAASTLIDTVLYATAFASAAAMTHPDVGLAYAVVYGLLLIAVDARSFAFTWLLGLSLGGSLLGVLAVFRPSVEISIVLIGCCAVGLYWTYYEGKNKKLRRENVELRSALTVSDELTNRSMDLALSRILLEVGHFLHEMRNRQMSMGTAVEFLRTADACDEDFQEALDDLTSENEQIRVLIDRLVAILRRGSQQRNAEFEVGEALNASCRGSPAGVTVRVDGPCPRCQVVGDPEQLAHVLKNLVRNARQAGAQNVTLRCFLEASTASVRVQVEDDGRGLAEEALAQLFEPFASHGNRSGTGLGLYLARRHVEMMGGQIEAANRARGGGARFTVSLPARMGPDGSACDLPHQEDTSGVGGNGGGEHERSE